MSTQTNIDYAEVRPDNTGYKILLLVLALLALAGLGAAHYMEVEGHHVTGMTNQIVWGMPHVFAIFLIVAASGALNIASLSSVFGRAAYRPLARYSAVLAVTLLVGGLAILLLDLGRPDRLIVAMTHYNFKSIFAWNIILYIGFVVIVAAYLWLMMERRMYHFSKPAGLVAREAYDTAILAPMFVILSFAIGLAVLILLLMLSFALDRRELDISHLRRLGRLLGIFTAAVFYFVLVYHLTKLYGTQNHGFERFILLEGGAYSFLFWVVQLGLGNLLPLALIYAPRFADSAGAVAAACALVIAGAFAQLYIIIVGGQAYPLNIFPGYAVESSFHDGVVNAYAPSLWEIMLGVGGLTTALLAALLVLRVLPIMPRALRAEAD